MGERIKEIRIDNKMSQKQFAEKIAVKQTTIASYENNINKPSNVIITLICETFFVCEKWLRHGNGDKNNRELELLNNWKEKFLKEYCKLKSKDKDLISFIIDKMLKLNSDTEIDNKINQIVEEMKEPESDIYEQTAAHSIDNKIPITSVVDDKIKKKLLRFAKEEEL
jgi:transcriptional regulator with XRE-family HTH domain